MTLLVFSHLLIATGVATQDGLVNAHLCGLGRPCGMEVSTWVGCGGNYPRTILHSMYMYMYMYRYRYRYMYRYRCMCVSFSLLLRAVAVVSLKIAETEQLYQGKRMIGGIGNVLLSTCSQTETGEDPLWGQVMTLLGQILVCRTDDDPLHPPPVCMYKTPSVCGNKTSPCVQAPRAHVETHVRVLPAYTGTF